MAELLVWTPRHQKQIYILRTLLLEAEVLVAWVPLAPDACLEDPKMALRDTRDAHKAGNERYTSAKNNAFIIRKHRHLDIVKYPAA